MASLSTGLEGLNLGANAEKTEKSEKPDKEGEPQLGAIPKRTTKTKNSKKSERNKNRKKKSELLDEIETKPPLSEEDPNLVPKVEVQDDEEEEKDISAKKTSNSQRRLRRGGKRHLKSTTIETDSESRNKVKKIKSFHLNFGFMGFCFYIRKDWSLSSVELTPHSMVDFEAV
jgi:hypothetical protein